MKVKIKKIQRHVVVYTDEYEMTQQEFEALFVSKEHFFNGTQEPPEEFKINLIIDEVSNRQGTYEEEWEVEFFEE